MVNYIFVHMQYSINLYFNNIQYLISFCLVQPDLTDFRLDYDLRRHLKTSWDGNSSIAACLATKNVVTWSEQGGPRNPASSDWWHIRDSALGTRSTPMLIAVVTKNDPKKIEVEVAQASSGFGCRDTEKRLGCDFLLPLPYFLIPRIAHAMGTAPITRHRNIPGNHNVNSWGFERYMK